jgi:hypothetical protein
MKMTTLPKVDKKAFAVSSLDSPTGEKEFWLNQTPYKRLAAIETMRQIVYGYNPLTTRLQRFFEVIKRT